MFKTKIFRDVNRRDERCNAMCYRVHITNENTKRKQDIGPERSEPKTENVESVNQNFPVGLD